MTVDLPVTAHLRIDPPDAGGLSAKADRFFNETLSFSFKFPDAMRNIALLDTLIRLRDEKKAVVRARWGWFVAMVTLLVLRVRLSQIPTNNHKNLYERCQLVYHTVQKLLEVRPARIPLALLAWNLSQLQKLRMQELNIPDKIGQDTPPCAS